MASSDGMPLHQPELDAAAFDTIAAISTPPGRGGIGIVRLSGPGALAVAAGILGIEEPLEHARARRAWVLDAGEYEDAAGVDDAGGVDDAAGVDDAGGAGGDADGAGGSSARDVRQRRIDEAIVTVFHAPRSYTGEDVVEIAAHGSPVVLGAILRGALEHGARLAATGRLAGPVRLATPGEFTQRAFLCGRLDLTQAEAVHDLIAAQTLDQARVAARQMGGAISRRVRPAKESLLHLIALLEAGMDFASGELDDVDVVAPEEIAASIAAVREPLAEMAGSFRRGQLLREGAAVALIGPPNAGKSSLFNRLLERERSIVTVLPGTTRDTVEEAVSLGGIPLRLIDTAGLRMEDEAADVAEQMGIARSRETLADADLVLLVHDATEPLSEAERLVAREMSGLGSGTGWAGGGARPHIVVHNKVDLLQEARGPAEIEPPKGAAETGGAAGSGGGQAAIRTSALTGSGIEDLRRAMLERLGASGSLAEAGSLNNLRQKEAVAAALAALGDAAAANSEGLPHELILLDLHAALEALDSLTGATTAEDILARIFSTFCIGK